MATYRGELEPLHGHNYAVTLEVEGSLTPDSWVIDFRELKEIGRGICQELDHRFLLQADSPLLEVSRTGGTVEVAFGERRYAIPAADVVALAVDNTTAERLAEWIAGRVGRQLAERGIDNLMSITVGVEESPGQSGWYTQAVR
jgi:6-pyruvoyltetrahydropterin/6-carboxytetrahydropterin synthase